MCFILDRRFTVQPGEDEESSASEPEQDDSAQLVRSRPGIVDDFVSSDFESFTNKLCQYVQNFFYIKF